MVRNPLTLQNILDGYVRSFTDGLELRGKSILPAGPKIIVANHTNGSDPIHLAYIGGEKIHCLFQKKLFNIPVLGKLMRNNEQICVDRENGRVAFEEACAYLNKGESIALFPEGKLCPRDARILAKSGAIRMALASGAPIIPLGFYVRPEDLIRLSIPSLPCGNWQIAGKCYARFGDPIFANESIPLDEQTQKMMDVVYKLVDDAEKDAARRISLLHTAHRMA